MLTNSQLKTYQFLKAYMHAHEIAPTIAEIANGLGLKAVSAIHRNIQAIAKEGLIHLVPNRQRNIVLVDACNDEEDMNTLPLVGRIAAGQPIEAMSQTEPVDIRQLFQGPNRYLLEVKGDSMIGDNICDGDLVVCQRSDTARDGQIAVVLVERSEATLKRVIRQPKKQSVLLVPSNPLMQAMEYPADSIRVQGLYIGLLRVAH